MISVYNEIRKEMDIGRNFSYSLQDGYDRSLSCLLQEPIYANQLLDMKTLSEQIENLL